ncbi:cell division topological specificity factor MinE [Buchnera aphidicola]|uniref:cell division topological specificity factor MinE n=1 Tax=Buchnera aphidicola TaxID=9 RepID=UPI0034641489
MTILDFFISKKKNTAHIAKERLKSMISEQKIINHFPDYFPKLKKEIIKVIFKYVQIKPEIVQIKMNSKDRNISVLELRIFFLNKKYIDLVKS